VECAHAHGSYDQSHERWRTARARTCTKGNQTPSGGHQEAIRRPSDAIRRPSDAIRRPPGGHREAIRRPSGGHQEAISGAPASPSMQTARGGRHRKPGRPPRPLHPHSCAPAKLGARVQIRRASDWGGVQIRCTRPNKASFPTGEVSKLGTYVQIRRASRLERCSQALGGTQELRTCQMFVLSTSMVN
jgi:hypothetical protein